MNTRSRTPFLLLTGAASAAAFALMARAVARRHTTPVDHKLHEQTAVPEGHPIRDLAEKASPIGKWWTYVPAAVATAGVVVATGREDRRAAIYGGLSIVAVAVGAALINKRLDALPQQPAPPGRERPDHPVFPSGHAFGTSAVAIAAAYVLSREELARAAVTFPAALLLPAITSSARMMEEKHWISDIIGGHLAGVALATLSLALYESARPAPPS